jgi:rare lipoprotein A
MVRTHIAIRWLAPAVSAVLLAGAMSATALASTGGTKAGNNTSVGKPVPAPVGSTLGAVTFTPATVPRGQVTVATGVLASSQEGQPVSLEIETKTGVWRAVETDIVEPNGEFSISWKASVVGTFAMRVVSGAMASSTSSVSTPEASLTVMPSVIATWYGPGFYGNRTACGERMTPYILGVADRTLPCGTAVTLYYNGQTLTVPVIDRGPYANGATFDLSSATAADLGITETVDIGFSYQLGKKIAPTNWYPDGATGPTGVTGASGVSGTSGPTGTTASGGAEAPS